ncbi:MAG: general secretion pathway protein GspB [Telluria sp.]
MSYILEALKKAQAERQLGNAPTIHAAPLHPVAAPAPASRTPLLIGLGAGVLAAAAMYALMRPAPAPVAAVPAVPPVTLAAAPAVLLPAPVAAPVPEPVPAPMPRAETPPPKPRKPEAKPVAVARAPEPKAPVAAPAAAPAPAEDSAPALSQLPEAIQREVPQIAVGGYIYSPNPADRLLLIDKVLRREGEEVAPGLTLERLLPKAAVLNFRGYRYRVPY